MNSVGSTSGPFYGKLRRLKPDRSAGSKFEIQSFNFKPFKFGDSGHPKFKISKLRTLALPKDFQ